MEVDLADLKLTVQAGPHGRVYCPVSAVVDAPAGVDSASLKDGAGNDVACQTRREDEGLRISWIIDDMAADTSVDYEVTFGGGGGEGVSLTEKTDEVEVSIGGNHFTNYRYGTDLVRPHLHPVIGPNGDPVTRPLAVKDDAKDHPHHRSVWISHGVVNGWNNWAEGEGCAYTRWQEFESLESGPVYGRIVALGDWVGSDDYRGEQKSNILLHERAEWTFYNTPSDVRIFDLTVTLTAPDIDVLMGDTKEGGLASIRVAESMEVRAGEGGVITNGYGGTNEDETWGKKAPWCHYSGPVNGNRVGIAIMDHPTSFRYPTYWHVRNYGLMTANPFGWSHFYSDPTRRGHHTIEANGSITGRYRYYIHAGTAADGKVGEAYHDFANPPQIEQA
ncbi:MAG: hypothetical protein CME26_06010 [Gemmatimonadetes bacterium]|nr:hypothetical protein [Gemmatimonadota bacterium]